jgi:ABC-type uncharacterized transport system auxiliary subunit
MASTQRAVLGRLSRFAGTVLIAGTCVSCLSGPAPTDHYYRIELSAPAALPQPVLAGTVEVDRFRTEAIAQGRRMLYRDASTPGEISPYAYHHWTEPPSVMLQDQLVEYLRTAGVAGRIVTSAVNVPSDYRINGRILHLERVLGSGNPRVVIELELTLIRNQGNEVLLLETYRDERETGGSRVSEAVAAYDEAVGAIFARFVADMPRT